MNINKTDLINALAEKKSYKKYAIKNAIDDIFAEIAERLVDGDKVSIRGFGTFEPKTFKGHPSVHPGTKRRIRAHRLHGFSSFRSSKMILPRFVRRMRYSTSHSRQSASTAP